VVPSSLAKKNPPDANNAPPAPRGSVSYAYDAAGRRTSMALSGQTALTNAYGNANRLTQISQGSANVSFGYDKDSLRTLAGGPDVKS